ncbi:anti-sigma factor [Terriglobus aquaticus]|uniref:Anti-sigma factor n=1 Tax=Terriglobus aquaticus TaxID=940139 RepID=A0ABW9KFX9_9BACT|nr:anti-sigma factor [Terriglobus aquaticus]
MKLFAHLFGKRPAEPVVSIWLDETHRERVMTDDALRAVQQPVAVPDDLQLRLRLAISHERVRADRRWWGRIQHQAHLFRENTLRPFAMPSAVVAGALFTVLGLGVMLGAVTPQQAVQANDVPLVGFSAPHYLYSAAPVTRDVTSADQAPLTVEARVDSEGRVYQYRVLSGTLTPATSASLQERMLNSVFKPASFFGEPVRGTVVLTFADVEVHG